MSENEKQAGTGILSAADLCDTIRTVRGAITNKGSALQSKALNRLLAHLDTITDIARAEGRHPSAVLADITGPARGVEGRGCVPFGARYCRASAHNVVTMSKAATADECSAPHGATD